MWLLKLKTLRPSVRSSIICLQMPGILFAICFKHPNTFRATVCVCMFAQAGVCVCLCVYLVIQSHEAVSVVIGERGLR